MTEEVLIHKYTEGEDIVEIRIYRVPQSEQHPEGFLYSCVYVRAGKRLVAYDNYGKHGEFSHHRHIKEHIEAYEFVDEWKLLDYFSIDVEKVKQGHIK